MSRKLVCLAVLVTAFCAQACACPHGLRPVERVVRLVFTGQI